MPTLVKIGNRVRAHRVSPVKMAGLQTVADVAGIVCLLLDHPIYMQKVGLMTLSAARSSRIMKLLLYFWLTKVLLDAVCNVVMINDDQVHIAHLKQKRSQLREIVLIMQKYEEQGPGGKSLSAASGSNSSRIKGISERIQKQNGHANAKE